MRIARTFSLVVGIALLAAIPAAAQSVSGTWVFSVNSPDGPVQMEVQLEQDGDVVKGDVQMDMAESAEISDGKLEDNVLTFMLHVGIQGETFSVEMTATVEGDGMTGEAFLADIGSMPFTATKGGGG